ncbi:hypothetical protein Tco_0580402 [Tanacetum coccineum]
MATSPCEVGLSCFCCGVKRFVMGLQGVKVCGFGKIGPSSCMVLFQPQSLWCSKVRGLAGLIPEVVMFDWLASIVPGLTMQRVKGLTGSDLGRRFSSGDECLEVLHDRILFVCKDEMGRGLEAIGGVVCKGAIVIGLTCHLLLSQYRRNPLVELKSIILLAVNASHMI